MEDIKENIEKQGKDPGDLTKMTFHNNFKHFTISSWFISYQIPSLSVQWFLVFKFYQRKFPLIFFLLRYLENSNELSGQHNIKLFLDSRFKSE